MHHVKKNSKNFPKIGPPNSFFRRAINLPNMSKRSNFFCQTTPNGQGKNYRHRNNIREMNLRFLEKNVSTEIRTRLKSLPIVDFLVNNYDFLTQRARKNDFNIKLMLETCSETSNYVYDVIS